MKIGSILLHIVAAFAVEKLFSFARKTNDHVVVKIQKPEISVKIDEPVRIEEPKRPTHNSIHLQSTTPPTMKSKGQIVFNILTLIILSCSVYLNWQMVMIVSNIPRIAVTDEQISSLSKELTEKLPTPAPLTLTKEDADHFNNYVAVKLDEIAAAQLKLITDRTVDPDKSITMPATVAELAALKTSVESAREHIGTLTGELKALSTAVSQGVSLSTAAEDRVTKGVWTSIIKGVVDPLLVLDGKPVVVYYGALSDGSLGLGYEVLP